MPVYKRIYNFAIKKALPSLRPRLDYSKSPLPNSLTTKIALQGDNTQIPYVFIKALFHVLVYCAFSDF